MFLIYTTVDIIVLGKLDQTIFIIQTHNSSVIFFWLNYTQSLVVWISIWNYVYSLISNVLYVYVCQLCICQVMFKCSKNLHYNNIFPTVSEHYLIV